MAAAPLRALVGRLSTFLIWQVALLLVRSATFVALEHARGGFERRLASGRTQPQPRVTDDPLDNILAPLAGRAVTAPPRCSVAEATALVESSYRGGAATGLLGASELRAVAASVYAQPGLQQVSLGNLQQTAPSLISAVLGATLRRLNPLDPKWRTGYASPNVT